MGAIENKLRRENRKLKAMIEGLRAGVSEEHTQKLSELRETSEKKLAELREAYEKKLKDQDNRNHTALLEALKRNNSLRKTIQEFEVLRSGWEREEKRLHSEIETLSQDLQKADEEPKKLRDRLQRVRKEKDATIQKLRQELQEAREQLRNTWVPPRALQQSAS